MKFQPTLQDNDEEDDGDGMIRTEITLFFFWENK